MPSDVVGPGDCGASNTFQNSFPWWTVEVSNKVIIGEKDVGLMAALTTRTLVKRYPSPQLKPLWRRLHPCPRQL